jgi:hypothetical protein
LFIAYVTNDSTHAFAINSSFSAAELFQLLLYFSRDAGH